MKKLSFLLLSVVAVGTTMVSCEKDEENNTAKAVVGNWKFKTMEIKINGQSTGQQPFNPTCLAEGKENSVNLKADRNYMAIGYDEENDCAASTETGTYAISDDGKTLIIDGEGKLNIIKLNATEMSFSEKYTEDNVTYEYIAHLKK